jgi:hypothetical protein
MGSSARFKRIKGREVSAVRIPLLVKLAVSQLTLLPQTSLLPFLFSKLETTDEDDLACADETILKALGSIRLEYQSVHNLRLFEGTKVYSQALPAPIHEQSKKAVLSHRAG